MWASCCFDGGELEDDSWGMSCWKAATTSSVTSETTLICRSLVTVNSMARFRFRFGAIERPGPKFTADRV